MTSAATPQTDSSLQDNPLLDTESLPRFDRIDASHVVPAVEQVIADNRRAIESLAAEADRHAPDDLIHALETMQDRLDRVWAPVAHLNAVTNSPALREAYNACLPALSDYHSELGQNRAIYRVYQRVRDSAGFATMPPARQRSIDNALRDFRLAGVALDDAERERFRAISSRLSTLTSGFADQLLDATNAWTLHLPDDTDELQGLPENSLGMLRQAARQAGKSGYLLGLDMPCVMAVLGHADSRALRRTVYTAFGTRASDQGPHAGTFDNGPLMSEILGLRQEQAAMLGYASFAELSLATKMAETTDDVTTFITDLASKARPQAQRELEELQAFATETLGLDRLAPWDIAYAAEKLRQARFDLSEEDLRPYFPADQVLQGLFEVASRLFGIHIRPGTQYTTWHPDVQVFEIIDPNGATAEPVSPIRGIFYTDLYARNGKRGGAWMAECRIRRHDQPAAAFLTCNFTPPVDEHPALLSHSEVLTLFHEFGHGLHHLLTRVDCPSVAGIRGVPWDAVELPSQFMENWCWEREALDLFAAHVDTGEAIPAPLFERMTRARRFHSALQLLRQLEFSLFDLMLHRDWQAEEADRDQPAVAVERIQQLLASVREQVAVVHPPAWHRFAHGFAHIFAGGYAAGYYSYKWAEVLSADAYSRFEEEGVFSQAAGQAFLTDILERGGSEDLMTLFERFRGRRPSIEPLLRQAGLAA